MDLGPTACAPSVSVQETAGLPRKVAFHGCQTGPLKRDIESGEYLELDAFKDAATLGGAAARAIERTVGGVCWRPSPSSNATSSGTAWAATRERGLLASPEALLARSTCRCGIDLAALALSDRESASRATVPPRMTRR